MHLGCLILAGFLGQLAIAAYAQPVTLASDLNGPTALAHVPGPKGGFRLLVAEEGRGLTEFTILGEGVLSRRSFELVDKQATPAEPVVGLGWYENQVLLLRPSGGLLAASETAGHSLTLSDNASDAIPLVGPPSLSQKWLIVPARGGLLRGRLAAGRVMGLRQMGPAVHAACFTPTGYVATLESDPAGFLLRYRDPEEPATPIASYEIDGLSSPRALAVRPTDATLYVLQAREQESATALVRLDVSDTENRSGPIRVAAQPIDAPDGITAMAFDSAGKLYVTTESGSLDRLDDRL